MQIAAFPTIAAENGVFYQSCPSLALQEGLLHCFSTRKGGVSPFPQDSLHLGGALPGKAQDVAENYRRLQEALGIPAGSPLAFSRQIHEDFVRPAGKEDCLPVENMREAKPCDGLLTGEKGVFLAGFFADCVPILLFDRKNRVCGMVHAGWRGTALGIAAKAVAAMTAHFGTNPAHVQAAVGPSIGSCCFLCHDDVPQALEKGLGSSFLPYIKGAADGRFAIDLKKINGSLLESAGVAAVYVSADCTCCQEALFFSHRRQGLARGSMGAWIGMQK